MAKVLQQYGLKELQVFVSRASHGELLTSRITMGIALCSRRHLENFWNVRVHHLLPAAVGCTITVDTPSPTK